MGGLLLLLRRRTLLLLLLHSLVYGCLVFLLLGHGQVGQAATSHSRFLREEEVLPSDGSTSSADDSGQNDELRRVQEFGRQFVKRRTEAADQEITLLSTRKHAMWYSEDGTKRKRFRSRGHDPRGHEVVHEVPLRIGDNWHLVFYLTGPRHSLEAETHHITVFQHMLDKALTVTHHTWVPAATSNPDVKSSEASTPQSQEAEESESIITDFIRSMSASFFSQPSPLLVPSPSSAADDGRCTYASACAPVKVATFNIWNFNEPWEERLQMINHHMAAAQPDVIGWQEVRYDISQQTRSQVEQLIELPAFKGYQFVWERGMTYLNFHSRSGWHVDEGVAVFSRFPITQADHRVLSRDMNDSGDREHQRVCLRARILPPGCRALDFLVTHLTLSDPARDRAVVEIAEWVQALQADYRSVPFVFPSYPSEPFIGYGNATQSQGSDEDGAEAAAVLVGDMNTEPGSRSIQLLLEATPAGRASFIDAWAAIHPTANDPHASPADRGLSFPSWKPQKRIDFILVKRAAETVKVLDVRLLGNSTLAPEKRDLHKEVSSDHLGLWALLDLSPSAPDGRSPTPRRDLPTITPVVNDEL